MDENRLEQEIREAVDSLPVTPAPGLPTARTGRTTKKALRFGGRAPLFAGAAVTAVIVATIAGSVVMPRPTPTDHGSPIVTDVSLIATATDGAEVLTSTAFAFTASTQLNPAQVRQALRITPAVSFDLRQEGNRLLLAPTAPLQPERLYRFALTLDGRTYQWAFQTPVKLRVLRTVPGDELTNVPITSGIELVLSRDDYDDPAPYLSISPSVPGRIERHRNTIAFVPTGLERGTVYTVLLRKGLSAGSGGTAIADDYSFAFETAVTAAPGESYFSIDRGPYEVAPTEVPALRGYSNAAVAVRVHRYPDAAAFIAAQSARVTGPVWATTTTQKLEPVAGLPQVASFTLTPRTSDYGGAFVFPEPLPRGFYLVELENPHNAPPKVQAHVQVSDLAFFATASTTQTVFWVHDLTTGAPARDARLRIGTTDLLTDANGIATASTATLGTVGVGGLFGLITAAGGKEVVAHVMSYIHPWALRELNMHAYWRYLYLDRPIYKPQDSVRYWGVALARDTGARPIDQVTLRIQRWDGLQATVLEGVAPVRDGTFSGSLALPNLRPGTYQVTANTGESQLTTAYFDVASYVKPAYSLALVPERRAVFAGEEIVVRLKTSFFEGTAAPAVPLAVTIQHEDRHVQTDGRGEALVRKTATSNANPETTYVRAGVAGPEAGEVAGESWLQVFQSSVHLTASQPVVAGGRATIPLKLATVVLDRINRGEEMNGPDAFLGGTIAGGTISVALSRLDWRRKDVGERYDFVNKEVVRAYEYEQVVVPLGSASLVTDGTGSASYSFPVATGQSYLAHLIARDSAGREHGVDTYVYGDESPERQPRSIEAAKPSWRIGETVEVAWRGGRKPTGPVAYLFYTMRSGIRTARVQTEPTLRFTFSDADVPATTVQAVRFDGQAYERGAHCYDVGLTVPLDRAERKLQVTVRPDRSEYAPGDQVTLAVETKDHTGQPTPASVNISAVDEAIFALSEQRVDLLGALYGQVPATGELGWWNSRPGDPSCGGHGATSGTPRSGFADVAHFADVRTDATGKATVGFKLPDNLTSWRVTYQAMSPKAEATSGTLPLVVRLPFFVDLVAAESYLTTDRPRIMIRSFGGGLAEGERVSFTVKLAGPVAFTEEVTAAAFAGAAVELPALVRGDYTLTVSAEGPRALKDAMEKRFSVQDSNLRRRVVDYHVLASGLRVAGAQDGVTTLTFTDYERGTAIEALGRMAGMRGLRVEQRLARDFAERWLADKFSIGSGAASPFDTTLYQRDDGGAAILPYGSSDPEVSAKLVDLAPDRFDRVLLEQYFENLLLDDQAARDQVIVALYGLAALDKPVLPTLRSLAATTDLTLAERLHLALAHAVIGDSTSARTMLRDIVRERGETIGPSMRLRGDGTRDDHIVATALAAALAAKLAEPEATALLRYTTENRPDEVLTLLEELIALKATLSRATSPVAFTYERAGTPTRVELAADQSLTLAVTANGLSGISFRDVTGKIGLAVSYESPLRLAGQQSRTGFSVTRVYELDGNVVKVQLSRQIDPSTATGNYQIVDFLPSGLRAIERLPVVTPEQCSQGPLEVYGQRVTLWGPNPSCAEVHYYARIVTPGDYVAEPAILQHVESGEIVAWSDPTRLVLGP